MELQRALKGGEDLICTCLWRGHTPGLYINAVVERQQKVLVAASSPESMRDIVNAAGQSDQVALVDSGKSANVLVCCLFTPIDAEIQASTRLLVIDIADLSLSKSLIATLQVILGSFPTIPKAIFTSCTNPTRLNLLSECLPRAVSLSNTDSLTLESTKHYKVQCEREDWKLETLQDLIEVLDCGCYLVFFESRREMGSVAYFLAGKGLEISAIHAKMPCGVVNRVINDFTAGKIRTLLLCDPVRVPFGHITVHYSVPTALQYLLRVGRGRLGRGLSIVLQTTQEDTKLAELERALYVKLDDLPVDVSDLL